MKMLLSVFLLATGSLAFAGEFDGAESVALAMAKSASSFVASKAEVIPSRTQIVGKYKDSGDGGTILEVAVRTYENSSADAVRIYRLREDQTGSIVRAVLFSSEGPVGP